MERTTLPRSMTDGATPTVGSLRTLWRFPRDLWDGASGVEKKEKPARLLRPALSRRPESRREITQGVKGSAQGRTFLPLPCPPAGRELRLPPAPHKGILSRQALGYGPFTLRQKKKRPIFLQTAKNGAFWHRACKRGSEPNPVGKNFRARMTIWAAH